MEALLEAEFHGALPAAEVPDATVDAHVLELRHRLHRWELCLQPLVSWVVSVLHGMV